MYNSDYMKRLEEYHNFVKIVLSTLEHNKPISIGGNDTIDLQQLKQLKQNIMRLNETVNMSPTKFAKLLHISPHTYVNIKRLLPIKQRTVQKIANTLNVNVDDLLTKDISLTLTQYSEF